MTEIKLPNQVYSSRQSDFYAIPSKPWVYWVSEDILQLFTKLPPAKHTADARRGLATGDNSRFYRYWWETGLVNIGLEIVDRSIAKNSGKKWFPIMKEGAYLRWYGNQYYIVNWKNDGYEIRSFFTPKGKLASRPQNLDYYFREGVTWSTITSKKLSVRYMPKGFIFSDKGDSAFSETPIFLLAILNSSLGAFFARLLSGTMDLTCGTIADLPIIKPNIPIIQNAQKCIRLAKDRYITDELSFEFIFPLSWAHGVDDQIKILNILISEESKIDDEVFHLYGVSNNDRITIETELSGVVIEEHVLEGENEETEKYEETTKSVITTQELGVLWLSFTIGIVLGRFQPGTPGALGSAIYRRTDFAIGSLPEPTEEEFNELVGEPSQFAYIDEQGGRHVFSRPVEQALQKLALTDGIAVFDPNHPRDLPTLVSKALELMLGQAQAQEVIQQAAGGDTTTASSARLRKFLEKDFFTQHHIKQYRKRPVYWPIQSSKRSYGFVLFHEKIDRNTFYALQQEPYLPTKRRAVQLRLEELGKKVLTAQGAARKPIEKEMDELRQLGEELAQFAKDLESITRGGYEPEADWIDDGVILRMAPLWSVIPLWKSEPKKYWEELAAGKYDWSRIAMKYWPERVKQACKKNKSYAIAHGHEEWFIGN